MEKEFIVKITEEQANYLQRLGVEVEAKAYLIDYMFANHMNNQNMILFDSAPFKHYEKQYEQAVASFNLAKQEFEHEYLDDIVYKKMGEKVNYNWRIDDYLSLDCKITVL